jgi:hypothetical protein
MSRIWYKAAVSLMWLVLPISAWEYRRVWDQLPARMAVHFDANWQPNGYTSPQGAAKLGLGIIVFVLAVFTLTSLLLYTQKSAAAWVALVFFYLVLGVCWYGNHFIVNFNLQSAQKSLQSSVLSSQYPNNLADQLRTDN